MATIEHKGMTVSGDVVVYEYSSGILYGHKLLKWVYVDEIDEYRYITEPVKIIDNKIVKYLHGSIDLLSKKEVGDIYPLKWTKDSGFTKGDILLGKDSMVFVYFTDDHVERLTPRSGFLSFGHSDRQGFSSLEDYETDFGPLVKAKPTHPNVQSF